MANRQRQNVGRHVADSSAYAAVKPVEIAQTRKRGPWFWIFVIAVVVLVGSLAALGVIAFSYLQGQQKYDRIADTAGFSPTEATMQVQLAEVSVDWDSLRAVNDDVVAWVYVPNTEINYPIVQGNDNDYYLTRDFDGDQGWLANYGCVFLDYRNTFNFQDQANFIYGHHMQDGSMFAAIAEMADQQKFDNARTVYLLTPQGNYKLRSFALVHCDANESIVQTAFANSEDRAAYMQDMMDRSVTHVADSPKAQDIERAMVFATCDDYSSGRFLLYCYIEDTTAADLAGDIGLASEDGQTTGFENNVEEVPTSEERK